MRTLRIIEHLFFDTLRDILYFPIWWYSKGFIAILEWYSRSIVYYARMNAIGVWIKNIFTPMFGQYDWQSRIVSFIVRIGNILVRGMGVLMWVILCTLLVIAYLLWLPTLAYLIIIYGF